MAPPRLPREAAARFVAGRWVYVSPEQPSGFCAVPPHWIFQPGLTPDEFLAALRAHGFAHRSEGATSLSTKDAERVAEIERDIARHPVSTSLLGRGDTCFAGEVRELLAILRSLKASPAPPPAAVDVVREAAEAATTSFGAHWCGDSEWLRSFTAALAARGVTFGGTT